MILWQKCLGCTCMPVWLYLVFNLALIDIISLTALGTGGEYVCTASCGYAHTETCVSWCRRHKLNASADTRSLQRSGPISYSPSFCFVLLCNLPFGTPAFCVAVVCKGVSPSRKMSKWQSVHHSFTFVKVRIFVYNSSRWHFCRYTYLWPSPCWSSHPYHNLINFILGKL